MRNLSPKSKILIHNGAKFAFGFDIKLENGRNLYLTNYSKDFAIGDLIYQSNSSIEISQAHFNDCACDWVELKGIFEENAIHVWENMKNAKITISILLIEEKLIENLLTFFCFSLKKENLQFTLHLKNQTNDLKKNATKFYSKSCRANLGDKECSVNLDKMSEIVPIIAIKGNTIFVDMTKKLGYYDYGRIQFVDDSTPQLIIKQTVNSLIMADLVPVEFLNVKYVKIFPGCDKSLTTCYNKFNNTLNFRGEPFIPEMNYDRVY